MTGLLGVIILVVSVLVGGNEVLHFFSEGQNRVELRRFLAIMAACIMGVSLSLNMIYLSPRATGEQFLASLETYDIATMRELACPDSSVVTMLADPDRNLLPGVSRQATRTISNVFYTPISNIMSFSLEITNNFSPDQTHDGRLVIYARNLTQFCVGELSGL